MSGASLSVGILCSRVREEEKRILQALRARGVDFERMDVRQIALEVDGTNPSGCQHAGLEEGRLDVVLIRCMSQTRGLCAARLLEQRGVRTINSAGAIATCGDKLLTTMALQAHGVPIPQTMVTFSRERALASMEKLGYPLVVKPLVGSWGRLLAKVNDREAAETVLEHRAALNPNDPFYVQEYIEKPGRDIRTLVVGDETVYAVYRHSAHWITNTALGGDTSVCRITPEIDRISRAAARAVGGEIVAVDLLEVTDGAGKGAANLLVNEVNHTPEFHGAVKATDADVAGSIVDYVLTSASQPPGGMGKRRRG